MKLRLQFFGGRGASGGGDKNLADGPSAGRGGGKNARYGQPNTPISWPKPQGVQTNIGDKGRASSIDEALKTVNPDRRAIDAMDYEDYTANCQRCVIAYELQRRGYKVEAEATFENDTLPSMGNYLNVFDGAKTIAVGASNTKNVNKKIIDNMSQWGNGSRAIVHIANNGGGHVFNVEYSRGKLTYVDAQTGDRYDPARVFNNTNPKNVKITRTDNLKINDNISKAVRKKRR